MSEKLEKLVSVPVTPTFHQKVKEAAEAKGVSMGILARWALNQYLAKQEDAA